MTTTTKSCAKRVRFYTPGNDGTYYAYCHRDAGHAGNCAGSRASEPVAPTAERVAYLCEVDALTAAEMSAGPAMAAALRDLVGKIEGSPHLLLGGGFALKVWLDEHADLVEGVLANR